MHTVNILNKNEMTAQGPVSFSYCHLSMLHCSSAGKLKLTKLFFIHVKKQVLKS
jgi:hypothetical protein